MEDFDVHFGGQLESEIYQIWCRVWMGFRDICLSVLEWFWVCVGRLFGAKTMTKRQREDFWKGLFYVSNIAVFVVCGLHLGCQNERKTEWDSDLDENSVL